MLTRSVELLAVAISAAMLMVASPARAEVFYPWCAGYSGGRAAGGTNCGFVTRSQCMATISGVGGWCYENPASPDPVQTRKRHRKKD